MFAIKYSSKNSKVIVLNVRFLFGQTTPVCTNLRQKSQDSIFGSTRNCTSKFLSPYPVSRNVDILMKCFKNSSSFTPKIPEIPIDFSKYAEDDILYTKKWFEMYKEEGGEAPDTLSDTDLYFLMECSSTGQQIKYLRHLAIIQFKQEKYLIKRKQEMEMQKLKVEALDNNPEHITYGLWRNTMFIKATKRLVRTFHDNGAINGILYGQPIILDFDYAETMSNREISSLSTQITILLNENRLHQSPTNLHFCNLEAGTPLMVSLQRRYPRMGGVKYPLHVHSGGFLDLFPCHKLVYLSPDSREDMKHINPDAIYIIGAIVDRGMKKPLTLSKAKRLGIKVQRLPLDRYLTFKGQKSLAVHVVHRILLDLQISGDWHYALRNVPRRLLADGQYDDCSPWSSKLEKAF